MSKNLSAHKRRRSYTHQKPLLIALTIQPASQELLAIDNTAVAVVAAEVLCPKSRPDSALFYHYTTNDSGSAEEVSKMLLEWLSRHTQSPTCVVVDLGKFALAKALFQIHFASSSVRFIDLPSMVAGGMLNLKMVNDALDTAHHALIGADGTHLSAEKEVEFIVAELTTRFPAMLPLSLRPDRRKQLNELQRRQSAAN
ncbi:MAG: hypothetical protein AAB391_02290 [Patescibacteria group bacterium]